MQKPNSFIFFKYIQISTFLLLFSFISIQALNGETGSSGQSSQNSNHPLDKIVSFKRLTVEDGLSLSYINAIIQDNQGFMWFLTNNGLNRYDGKNIRIYQQKTKDPFSLSSNRVQLCHLDRRGNLWFLTYNGVLHRYDPEIDGFRKIPLGIKGTASGKKILQMVEDSSGKIWFATRENGIISYTPKTKSLKTYTRELIPSNQQEKSTPYTQTILPGKDNILWIGTDTGLVRYDQKKNEFFHYPYRPLDSTAPNNPKQTNSPLIIQIKEDAAGRLWIGSIFGGLQRLDKKKNEFLSYPFNKNKTNSFKGNTAYLIFEDTSGKLWISGRPYKKNFTFELPGFASFDPTTSKITRYSADSKNSTSLSQDNVKIIMEDANNRLWMHTFGGGIDLYNPESDSFSHFKHDPKDLSSLSSNHISAIFEDQSGTIWIGTANGICFFDPLWKKFPHYLINAYAPFRDSNQAVQKILGSRYEVDDNGIPEIIWLGTKAGLNRWDRKTNTFTFFEISPKIPDLRPKAIFEDLQGYIWIGSGMGLHKARLADLKKKNSIPVFEWIISRAVSGSGDVTSIVPGRDDNFWIGINGVGLGYINSKNHEIKYFNPNHQNLKSLIPTSGIHIYPGNNNTLWITSVSGLNLFDIQTETFKQYSPENVDFSARNIQELHQAPDGIVWLGTTGEGLWKYNPETSKVTKYLKKDGLPSNTILAIINESSKNQEKKLWISTTKGLGSFNIKKETFEKFSTSDGLQGSEFSKNSSFLSPDGEMFFGGKNGFNAFYSKHIYRSNYSPPVYITDFKILNRSIQHGENSVLKKPIEQTNSIALTYKDRIISFEFAALHYPSPGKIQYAYFLEGFENDWNYCQNRQFTNYTNLPHGKYTFRVKATNCDGLWSEHEASVKILISPPFWLTWWFKCLTLIVLFLLIFISFKKIKNKIEQKYKKIDARKEFYIKNNISNREREIIDLIVEGKKNKEIEDLLFISIKTVNNHKHNIYRKLNINSSGDLRFLINSISYKD